ncbi:hypothetical protein ACCQ14_09920 [Xanthomonas sp. NCPPB 2865]|uniref:hypothetical protein n=1 Tax=unclassified Xanthomonas TaxID=2643310 RepID=UPI001CF899BE|nr:hypothetical protein [Xanthomonas sp. MWU16-30325]
MELLEPQMAWSTQYAQSTPPRAAFFVDHRMPAQAMRMQQLKPWPQSFIINH